MPTDHNITISLNNFINKYNQSFIHSYDFFSSLAILSTLATSFTSNFLPLHHIIASPFGLNHPSNPISYHSLKSRSFQATILITHRITLMCRRIKIHLNSVWRIMSLSSYHVSMSHKNLEFGKITGEAVKKNLGEKYQKRL